MKCEALLPQPLRALPTPERPRERLMRYGPKALSSFELLAIVLGSGTRKVSVLQLAHNLLAHFGGLEGLKEASLNELCAVRGVGQAKALQIQALFGLKEKAEQKKRDKVQVTSPSIVYDLVKETLVHALKEHLVVLLLDCKGFFMSLEEVSIGTLSSALAHPREVFYPAIRHKAASLVLAHNHPSGDVTPSPYDREVTEVLIQAGKLMSIPVQDHVIVSKTGYYSLRERGSVKFIF